MSDGKCLCGEVRWKIKGEPQSACHCHCSMCRKAHGAAFGTYYFFSKENFEWMSTRDSVIEYRSSAALGRAFCGECGSVVPVFSDDGATCYVPAGSHDDGPAVRTHIFVGSCAPWNQISDDLECFDNYPEQHDLLVIADKTLAPQPQGVVRGSCLCGEIAFQVTEPFKVIHNCYCSRCRQARAAAYTTNGFTSMEGVKFIKGEEHIKTYKVADARFFAHAFCDKCGSGMPRIDAARKIAVIPLGALDDDPVSRPIDHIYTAYKADWFEITDELPVFDQAP